jgi:hypothetical protein
MWAEGLRGEGACSENMHWGCKYHRNFFLKMESA